MYYKLCIEEVKNSHELNTVSCSEFNKSGHSLLTVVRFVDHPHDATCSSSIGPRSLFVASSA
jgi:hypothetical protein